MDRINRLISQLQVNDVGGQKKKIKKKLDQLNISMFRAYDIRTPAKDLTDALAVRLFKAESVYYTQVLGVKGVVMAHDARLSGPHMLQLGALEFARAGLQVLVVSKTCSTPMLYFAAMQHPQSAAIMIGASHNPAGDTGQKLLAPNVDPIAEHIGPEGGLDKVKVLYLAAASLPPAPQRGVISLIDPTEAYVDYSMRLARVAPGSLKGARILHDYVNGSVAREMMIAFQLAGVDMGIYHFAPDGQFPLGDPNPVKAKVVKEGLDALKRGNFLLGTFFDGDGDRIDFYGGDGTYLSSSFVFAGILPEIRKRFPAQGLGVFADLKSNPLAIIEMARCGFSVSVCRNGHSQIKKSMIDDPKMIATVEESAHFYEAFELNGGRFCTENSLYLALLVTKTWFKHPERYQKLFALQAKTARQREWGFKFPSNEQRDQALNAVERHFNAKGLKSLKRMPNGYDLEATMMRAGLPFEIDASTRVSSDWVQVCQRISQSENGLARWEVCAAKDSTARQAKADINEIVKQFGAGTEYQG